MFETSLSPLYHVGLIAKDNQHFYTVDMSQTFLPGVTGILSMRSKDALVPWATKVTADFIFKRIKQVYGYRLTDRFMDRLYSRAKKQPRFEKESAAYAGTNAHNIFDSIICREREVKGETIFMESFAHWLKTEKLKIVKGDTKIASLQYGYGGSLDVLLQDEDGKLVIGDFKTGKNLYDSHAYQVAAYSQAFKETYGLDYRPQGVVLRFCKGKAQYERREVSDIDIAFEGFKACLDMFHNSKYIQFKNRELVKVEKVKKEKVLI